MHVNGAVGPQPAQSSPVGGEEHRSPTVLGYGPDAAQHTQDCVDPANARTRVFSYGVCMCTQSFLSGARRSEFSETGPFPPSTAVGLSLQATLDCTQGPVSALPWPPAAALLLKADTAKLSEAPWLPLPSLLCVCPELARTCRFPQHNSSQTGASEAVAPAARTRKCCPLQTISKALQPQLQEF